MYTQAIENIRKNKYTLDNVHEAAEKILAIGTLCIPVKIIDICQKMGFSVFQQEMPNEICGYIAIDEELKNKLSTDRIISVNKGEPPKRRRFTVAHELGHFLFNFNPKETEYLNAFEMDHEDDNEDEKRANRFAAELLMPKEEFTKKYYEIMGKYQKSSDQLNNTVQDLSDLFLVPPKAVERRIKKELNLYGEQK